MPGHFFDGHGSKALQMKCYSDSAQQCARRGLQVSHTSNKTFLKCQRTLWHQNLEQTVVSPSLPLPPSLTH